MILRMIPILLINRVSVTEEMSKKLVIFASKYCKNRLVSTLEGGYNIKALSKSSLAHVKGLIL